jgi:hypothetical protein
VSTASSTNGAPSSPPPALELVESEKRDTEPCKPPPRPRRNTLSWWRARIVQPGYEAFFATLPFQAEDEGRAIAYAAQLTGRPKTEIEVVGVDAPAGEEKGRKR